MEKTALQVLKVGYNRKHYTINQMTFANGTLCLIRLGTGSGMQNLKGSGIVYDNINCLIYINFIPFTR